MKVIMEYITVISRLLLIGMALYGTFIFLAVVAFWNVTDWDLSFPGKKGENR